MTAKAPRPFRHLSTSIASKRNFLSKRVASHTRRALVALLSLVCRSRLPFLALGALNRLIRRLDSVFFCYAGNQRYAEYYSPQKPRCAGGPIGPRDEGATGATQVYQRNGAEVDRRSTRPRKSTIACVRAGKPTRGGHDSLRLCLTRFPGAGVRGGRVVFPA